MKHLPYASDTAKTRVQKTNKSARKKVSRRKRYFLSFLFYILVPSIAVGLVYKINPSALNVFAEIKYFVQQKIESITTDPKNLTRKFTNAELHLLNNPTSSIKEADRERQEFMKTYHRASVHSLHYYDSKITRLDILQDKYEKIPPAFNIPQKLRLHVGFWLNIYSKFSSRYYILHHEQYPWLVYDIVDTNPILQSQQTSQGKQKAIKSLLIKRKNLVVHHIKALKQKKKSARLTKKQKRYARLLSKLKGKKITNINQAMKTVHIQVGQKDNVKKGFISGLKHPTKIEEIFAKYQIPTRYKYSAKDIVKIIKEQRARRRRFSPNRFLSEFLAALYVERYQKEIFGLRTSLPLKKTKAITLSKKLQIREIIKKFSINFKDLKLFNPRLRHRNINVTTWVPKGYHLHLPKRQRS